jgi:hypothetical protein
MNDKTRTHDIEDIENARKEAKTTQEREKFERLSHQIKSENLADKREELVSSMRSGDHKHRKYMEREIKRVEQDRKYGRASV